MSVLLFHRTTIGDARAVVKRGFVDERWNFGVQDPRTGAELKVAGVWLSDRPLQQDEGPPGDAVLEVLLDAAEEELEPFALHTTLWEARLWVVPAALINRRGAVRIHGVDPRTSFWYKAHGAEGEEEEEEQEGPEEEA